MSGNGNKAFRERASARQAVELQAKIVAPDLSRCIDCTVRDISDGGVLVSFRSFTNIPDRIYLWQADTGAMIECEVRWRKLNLMGLRFLDTKGVAALRAVAAAHAGTEKVMSFRLAKAA